MNAGERCGRWTTLEKRPGGYWLCRCDCGTEKVVYVNPESSTCSRSCGCLRRELAREKHTTHGQGKRGRQTVEYTTYRGMMQRCHNEHASGYYKYGGRGIAVCDRWRTRGGFVRFFADMGRRPSPEHSLGRIDNDGPYSPDNCRWETRLEQARNKRNNRWIAAYGRTLTLSEWSRQMGVDLRLIHKRLTLGWNPERAVSA
jgi:hypothetical protein